MRSHQHRLILVIISSIIVVALMLVFRSVNQLHGGLGNDSVVEDPSQMESYRSLRSRGNITTRVPLMHESLEEAIKRVAATPPYVVPNIVHFIWFAPDGKKQFSFLNYLSILSASRIQKPDLILFHSNFLPAGKWWRRLWRRVTLTVNFKNPPRQIFGQPIGSVFHAGDVTKLELMLTYGGIYLDTDVIVVNSLDPLRLFNATMGKEKPPKLIAGIMIGAPGAEFYRIFYESYRGDYRRDDWDYNCARRPFQIYAKRPELVHVEPYKLTTPDFQDRHLLFDDVINWRELYVVHVMAHLISPDSFSPGHIRTSMTTFGEVARYIHYGSSAVRPW